MKRKAIFTVLFLCLALSIFFITEAVVYAGVGFRRTPADAGSFSGGNDYDFDPGGNNWGGSGDSWGSSSSDGGGGDFSPTAAVVILIIVIFIIIKSKKGKGGKGSSKYTPTVRHISPQESAAVAGKVRAVDPFFTEAEMREKVANLYVEMQRCWEKQDWEPMRFHLTDDLFSQMERQLKGLIDHGQINKMERIAVMDVSFTNFYQDDQFDNLTLRLQTRLVDYTIDRKTGAVVSGDPNREKFMTYEWTMVRTKGAQSSPPGDGSGKKETSFNCPHCGAPIDLTQSARCGYCGSIVKASEFDWVLSRIRGIAQQTM